MADPRIIDVELDAHSVPWRSTDAAGEYRVAIRDLLERNRFASLRAQPDGYAGPYRVALSVQDGRLVLAMARADGTPLETLVLALGRFRRPIRDYLAICDSYARAVAQAGPGQAETVDMARRALHNEAAELLRERLAGKVEVDFDTARRLWTLICALHMRG